MLPYRTVVKLSCALSSRKHFPTSDFVMDYHAPSASHDEPTVLLCTLALYQISARLTLVCCMINLPCCSAVSRLLYLFKKKNVLILLSSGCSFEMCLLLLLSIDMLLYQTVAKLSCALLSVKHFPTSDL